MASINRFLLEHGFTIRDNPCISPDFCLDWASLRAALERGDPVLEHPASKVSVAAGELSLRENAAGDHAWVLEPRPGVAAAGLLAEGAPIGGGRFAYPATFDNLVAIKNLVQEHDPASTVFPSATGTLERSSLGVGARFTTLHWPAVEWAMAELSLSMTANQNSIPRELVYDVNAMLRGALEGVPFPFIGADVPEGHQGQSVQGMSHGAVLSKLKTGFHARRIPWGFNADHQPIGGSFDRREAELVSGCLFASYITFDLSPELSVTPKAAEPAAWCAANVPAGVLDLVRARVSRAGVSLADAELVALVAHVWPAVAKMQRRDRLYGEARQRAFTTPVGRAYFRELSIDELPGLTEQGTLATMLALCEALDVRVDYVAPAFGFQKNFPFEDGPELERRVSAAFEVCRTFDVSIGFHSGSGKSADNYRTLGRVTGGRLEIKTSGRYTYEMGRALAASEDAGDRALFEDWYRFTRELALESAFSERADENKLSRSFIAHALELEGRRGDVFESRESAAQALAALVPSPEHMFFFEYNFLFVLAAGGSAAKSALGDHGPEGYRQRARFYAISDRGKLGYVKRVAEYLCFLAEETGLSSAAVVGRARDKLARTASYGDFLAAISEG